MVTNNRALDALTAEDFMAVKDSRFRLTTGSPPADGLAFEVELADVSRSAGSGPGSFRAPFSVLFHGPLQPILPQGIYRLEHDQFGAIELFLVPLGPDQPAGAAMRYEAVFG